jgi:hypothetical protein
VRIRHPEITAALALAVAASLSAPAFAATSAYWRHEEGPAAGALIPAGANTVLDSSGNGNHMQTFNPTFTSASYSTDVSPLPLRSGLPNNFSLDFGPGGDDAGLNDDNFTTGDKPVSGQLFSAMTIEMAFKMDTVSGYQAIFGKDGKPLGDAPGEPDLPIPPIKFLIRGDNFPDGVNNQLFVEFIDGDGATAADDHFVTTRQTVVAGKWYHVAFTLDTQTAQLWVAGETGPYQLLDSITGDFVGPKGNVLVEEALGWSAGRGMFNNGVTDWADAKIDEIRISDTVLTPNQFLFVAPEPACLALAPLAVLVARRVRRG